MTPAYGDDALLAFKDNVESCYRRHRKKQIISIQGNDCSNKTMGVQRKYPERSEATSWRKGLNSDRLCGRGHTGV